MNGGSPVMSLVDALRSPHTPVRRFLDRELSAGAKPLRASYRAQHRADHVLLLPPGVGTEAGTVGTAIELTAGISGTGPRLHTVGGELAARLTETVRRLDLDNRDLPLDRAQDEEEDLARLLIAAAWYQVLARTAIGFTFTPLAEAAPAAFTLPRLLALRHQDLVADVTAQLHHAAHGPLEALRARTRPGNCTGGPTFAGARISADADLVVDGLLLDFKSARRPLAEMTQRTAWQLTGYLLLDATDRYRIDTVGLYLTRSAVLATWPVDDYLALLGACRRDLTELRQVFAELLDGSQRRQPDARFYAPRKDAARIRKLLQRLAPAAGPGCCPVCTQPLPDATRGTRTFCTPWCRGRAQTLRRRGLLPTGPAPLLPAPRKQRLDLPDDAEIVDLTVLPG
jgi:hypothetical protein